MRTLVDNPEGDLRPLVSWHVKGVLPALACVALALCPPPGKAQTQDEPVSPASPTVARLSLPDAPQPQQGQNKPSLPPPTPQAEPQVQPTLLGTPKRILLDEAHIITSPARLRPHNLIWLLPVAGATAASLATDTRTNRDVVSHDPDFNSSAVTSSNVLLGLFIGGPAALFGAGQYLGNAREREAGLLAGEALIDSYVTSEGIKYITLRERPNVQNARGYFFQGDAVSNPSFVSGHSIAAWSSAAVLASEYSKPWQQVGLYTLATGVSLTRVLGQEHFPTDVLLGSVSGWLIGRYVYKTHRNQPAR